MENDKNAALQNYSFDNEKLMTKIKNLEETIDKFKQEDTERNKKVQAIFREIIRPSQVLI